MKNMQQLLKQAQKLQGKLSEAQKDLEIQEVIGTSGSGLVNVTMTLKGIVRSIELDNSIIDPNEKEVIEDLLVAAMNDAKQKADKKFDDGMKEASGGMDLSQITGGMF
ncbi:MAG: YbaB/EbfC family nucleoid-associated protein [Holosporales bacterium]|jgi:DNA-binding YbaB/EbfC family protein|nr:YbaB/EbfC family nucleoid-associated protein [Holosporales bacterium]